jgi:hypothetical protein
MRTVVAVFVLLVAIGVPALQAQVEAPAGRAASDQAEESVDSSQPTDSGEVVTSSTSTTVTTTVSPTPAAAARTTPSWIHLVRIAATAGPIAFLVLAWMVSIAVHYRLVRKEQAQFPAVRGSRAPQTVPMVISAALFFIPAVLFILFEVRSRQELRRGIGGVVDEWQPVTTHAWIALLVCLVLALVPWLFARRADTVS